MPHIEEIRLLGNIETPTEKLLSIILIGQSELSERLDAASMRQLKQRVALRCTLAALDIGETISYIGTRLRVAGGDASTIFNRAAVGAIFSASGGIPRTISVICENALINGFALQQRPIGTDIIVEVCRDHMIAMPADVATAPATAPADERPPAPFSFF